MALADLIAHGPGDNIYLDLSDIRLIPELAVIETEGLKVVPKEQWSWTYAWIPAVPLNQTGKPNVNQVRLIVGTKVCSNAAELMQFCQRTKVRGLIVNETDSLKSDERKLLNQGLPGVDVASCYLLRDNHHPTGRAVQVVMLGGGGLLLLAGLGLGGLLLRQKYAG